MRRWLPTFAVRRPVTVAMMFMALMVLGSIAYARIPLQMMPSGFDYPFLWVWLPYPNSTPMETESQIVRPVEEQLATVAGIKELSSRANEGSASFEVEFHQSADLDDAYNAVVDRLERVMPELPADVQNYGVYRYDPSDEAVLWMGATFDEALEDPNRLMTEIIQRRLERVSGVGRVDVWGTAERLVFIDFDREALSAHGVNLYELMQSLQGDNFQLASGRLEERGEVRYVRSLARYESIEDLQRTPVSDGVVLEDIAEVSFRGVLSADIYHLDGRDGAGVAIYKESSANTVAVCQAVQEALDELSADPRLGGGVAFHVFFDQGDLIEDSVNTLLETAAQGGLFAVLVLLVFLRDLRLTLLIAASIPLSLLLSVTALYFTSGTLNLLSMMGLMIAVGMVVDNAIVVVETIYRRRRDGAGPSHAAIEGTSEVNLAITLSTMTTMVVFLPLILMSEDAMFSFFMGALGFPVVFALAASLIVAVVFTPLATVWVKDRGALEDPRWIRWLLLRYERALSWVLSRRTDSAIGVLALLLLTAVVPMRSVGCTDQAEGNLGDFVIGFEVPASYTLGQREALMSDLEALVDANEEAWGVRVHRSWIQGSSTRGRVHVFLEDEAALGEGALDRDEVLDDARAKLPERPGASIWIGWGRGGSGNDNTLTVYLEGDDTETLLTLADGVLERLRQIDGVLSAQNTLERTGNPEIRLAVDREAAARYGVSASTIGQTLSFAMRGAQLPDLHEEKGEVQVQARFALEDRADLDALLDFEIWSPTTMAQVPLRSLVDAEVGRGFDTIRRRDRKTSLGLQVELDPDLPLDEAGPAIDAALSGVELPRGYSWSQGRRFDDQMANDDARNKALLLSVTFVFLLMGVLFESFLLPVAIITTIPMALIGVFWTLYLTDTPMDMMGGVGLVVLVGVVVNNGIVLIDLVTQLRAEGVPRDEALIQAGARRMRPIVMTALTTLFGLLPMALGTSSFVGIPYAPLGRVVGGGLAAATLLTLFFVPFLYSLLDDVRGHSGRLVAFALGGGVAAPPGAPLADAPIAQAPPAPADS